MLVLRRWLSLQSRNKQGSIFDSGIKYSLERVRSTLLCRNLLTVLYIRELDSLDHVFFTNVQSVRKEASKVFESCVDCMSLSTSYLSPSHDANGSLGTDTAVILA